MIVGVFIIGIAGEILVGYLYGVGPAWIFAIAFILGMYSGSLLHHKEN